MAFSGCGKPFNVRAKTDLPAARYSSKTSSGGIEIQAQAIRDEDFLYQTFDSNLISAGVLPVRVMLENSTDRPIGLKDAHFEIRQKTGNAFKSVSAREAYKRLISYYEIKAYSKAGYKESLDDFSEYGIDLKAPLEGGQARQGLLFFLVPDVVARTAGLTMIVSKIGPDNPDRVELTLN